ncbi:GerW family sporulation protein [Methanobacterium alcaliphilum]|uniref:GerW family sporulation protein n=1 Tax=Methanobacterium alcaliphilum TaxID=392018 RepID=UPI002009EC3D|nr:spore germination protein GerW family protein [Methanobacterium alcaliphilum]MCK9151507.1 sporulation protein [Methanobacterium alcaliphilum]
MEVGDPIKTTVEELRKLLEIQNFVGDAIETEDKLLIPVMKMGMGFGAGTGEGKGPDSEGEGGLAAAGAAAGVEPVAMVVVTKGVTGPEGIRVLNLTSGSPLSKAIGEVGTVITDVIKETAPMVKERQGKRKTKKQKKEEEKE